MPRHAGMEYREGRDRPADAAAGCGSLVPIAWIAPVSADLQEGGRRQPPRGRVGTDVNTLRRCATAYRKVPNGISVCHPMDCRGCTGCRGPAFAASTNDESDVRTRRCGGGSRCPAREDASVSRARPASGRSVPRRPAGEGTARAAAADRRSRAGSGTGGRPAARSGRSWCAGDWPVRRVSGVNQALANARRTPIGGHANARRTRIGRFPIRSRVRAFA